MRFLAGIACAAFACATYLIPGRLLSTDTWWHLAAGKWILENLAVPQRDFFSWTMPGADWTAHEWGFEALAALAWRAGPPGLWLLSCGLTLLAAWCLWGWVRRAAPGPAALGAFLLLLPAVRTGWTARPQLLGYAFFFGTLWILQAARERSKLLWLLPPLFVGWANCHASVSLGLAVVALEVSLAFIPSFRTGMLEHRPGNRKALALVLAACAAASLANPWGWKVHAFALRVTLDPAMRHIQEWSPPCSAWVLAGTAAAVLALFLALTLNREARVDLRSALLAGGALLATAVSFRWHVYWAGLWAALLAQALAGWRPARWLAPAGAGLLLGLALVWAWHFGWIGRDADALAERAEYPVRAADFLAENGGRVLNPYGWGGYLIYRGVPVFVDGRADMYHAPGSGDDPYLDSVAWGRFLKDPEEIANRRGANYVLVPANGAHDFYFRKAGWREVYRDDWAAVFARGG